MTGNVEIFRVNDEGYYKIFVDGKSASLLYKGSANDCVLRRAWRRAEAKKAGLGSEDGLRYTHYDVSRSKASNHHDADAFEDYQLCKDTVVQEGIKPKFKGWTLDQFEEYIAQW